ncbi:hypothetical protein [Brevibacillus massiliensis]|uniref:hypothetical protein n=1 Tax=Brevibacillus massiliensis TaxID=1118054 RepID=UPI00030D9FE1
MLAVTAKVARKTLYLLTLFVFFPGNVVSVDGDYAGKPFHHAGSDHVPGVIFSKNVI